MALFFVVGVVLVLVGALVAAGESWYEGEWPKHVAKPLVILLGFFLLLWMLRRL